MTDLFTLESTALPTGLRVAGFRGTEALSKLYRFDIGLLTDGHRELELARARGAAVTLQVCPRKEPTVLVHGMIARLALEHCWQGHALYRLVLVPSVWAMTLGYASRVFVELSIPEIAEQLLSDSGIGSDRYELRLRGTYPKRLHVCQYQESRWAFLSRLLEREGIYYFFEQTAEAEKLILTDHRSFHASQPETPVRYVPLSGTNEALSSEALASFTAEQACLPQSIRVRDYDDLNPALEVVGDADIGSSVTAPRKTHGEGALTEAQARSLAQTRAEQWLSEELVYRGTGRVLGLRPGYRFRLEEHPLEPMNRELLVTELRHHGNQAAGHPLVRELLGLGHADDYRIEVQAIDAQTQFRPPLVTPKPCISGLERAFIDGPAQSDYAQLDEHGRYKVKLHFDLDDSDARDGKASTWIRMLQPHGGNPEGMHLPLRKGTEVLVAFLAGDPDRPVIVGAIPNAVQPSPVTSANATRNVIHTGGNNRIELEDEEGRQFIRISCPTENSFLHMGAPNAPRNLRLSTDGKAEYYSGDSLHFRVGGGGLDEDVLGPTKIVHHAGRKDTVTAGVDEYYQGEHQTVVEGTRIETVTGAVDESYASRATVVKAAVNEQFGSQSVAVKGDQTIKVGGALTEAAASVTQTYGPVTTTSGTWSGLFASWNLSIPGGVRVNASRWKAATPEMGTSSADFTMSVSKKTEVNGTAFGASGVKFNVSCFAGLKASLRSEEAGVKTKKSGTSTEQSGVKTVDTGVTSFIAGFFSVS